MNVTPVDPRDQNWEIASPKYRVYFWEGTAADEYELDACDVAQAEAWAQANRGTRTYTLYVCVPVDGLGLVLISGVDPSGSTRS